MTSKIQKPQKPHGSERVRFLAHSGEKKYSKSFRILETAVRTSVGTLRFLVRFLDEPRINRLAGGFMTRAAYLCDTAKYKSFLREKAARGLFSISLVSPCSEPTDFELAGGES